MIFQGTYKTKKSAQKDIDSISKNAWRYRVVKCDIADSVMIESQLTPVVKHDYVLDFNGIYKTWAGILNYDWPTSYSMKYSTMYTTPDPYADIKIEKVPDSKPRLQTLKQYSGRKFR